MPVFLSGFTPALRDNTEGIAEIEFNRALKQKTRKVSEQATAPKKSAEKIGTLVVAGKDYLVVSPGLRNEIRNSLDEKIIALAQALLEERRREDGGHENEPDTAWYTSVLRLKKISSEKESDLISAFEKANETRKWFDVSTPNQSFPDGKFKLSAITSYLCELAQTATEFDWDGKGLQKSQKDPLEQEAQALAQKLSLANKNFGKLEYVNSSPDAEAEFLDISPMIWPQVRGRIKDELIKLAQTRLDFNKTANPENEKSYQASYKKVQSAERELENALDKLNDKYHWFNRESQYEMEQLGVVINYFLDVADHAAAILSLFSTPHPPPVFPEKTRSNAINSDAVILTQELKKSKR